MSEAKPGNGSDKAAARQQAIERIENQQSPASAAPVLAGFGSRDGFDLMLRQAKWLCESSLVPEQFRGGSNIGNVVIALEMASRLEASPLAIMQNLYIVHGKPGWSASFIIAAINATGKFSPLRFAITDPEPEKEVAYSVTEYVNGQRNVRTGKEKIRNRTCVAWAIEKATGDRLESPPVSLEMAVMEGWMVKSGSKWKTMPELMLRYRTATFFGRLYAPDVLMGMKTTEEIVDIGEEAYTVKVEDANQGPVVDIKREPEPNPEPARPEPKPDPKPEPKPEPKKTVDEPRKPDF